MPITLHQMREVLTGIVQVREIDEIHDLGWHIAMGIVIENPIKPSGKPVILFREQEGYKPRYMIMDLRKSSMDDMEEPCLLQVKKGGYDVYEYESALVERAEKLLAERRM